MPDFITPAEAPATRHPLRNLVRVCWFLLGAVFIFSGLVKLNDPLGTAYKLEEYFEVFAESFSPLFLNFKDFSKSLSIIFCSSEVILGVALLLRWHLRFILWALLALLVFFAFLTFYSAAFNKVTDCGCFGDFIKLTPWTSFGKDLFLLVLWAVVFFNQRFLRRSYARGTAGIMLMTVTTAVAVGIGMRALGHLPYFDPLPYKVGADLKQLMKPQEKAQYRYTYTRNGETKEFDDFPTDTTWKYKSMALLNPETSRAKITDFKIYDPDGQETNASGQSYTDLLLTGNKLIIIIQNTNKANRDEFEAINKLVAKAEHSRRNLQVLAITSSNPSKFDAFRHEMNLAVPYYTADGTVLKSVIRSNPGLMVLKDGVVLAKYHYHDIPNLYEVEKLF